MLASVLRSCFGTCFRRFGGVGGYESLENPSEDARVEDAEIHGKAGYMFDPELKHNEYTSVLLNFDRAPNPDYRSRSTGEIFRGYEIENTVTSEKRSFSMSIGYLNDRQLYNSLSGSVDNVWTSAADLRSEVSDAFYSCKGSLFDLAYYSDSEDGSPPCDQECDQCGIEKHHDYSELERDEWSSTPLVPKSAKWIQLS